MDDDYMLTRWQETFHKLFVEEALLPAKAVANRLHRHPSYVADVYRADRPRIDPFAIANATLIEAEQFATNDPDKMAEVARRMFSLLTDGTSWTHQRVPDTGLMPFKTLLAETGPLLEDLGTAIKSVAQIEADGKYTPGDAEGVAMFANKAVLLSERLLAMSVELKRRMKGRTVS